MCVHACVGVCLWVCWVVVWVGWELLLIMYSNFFTLHFFLYEKCFINKVSSIIISPSPKHEFTGPATRCASMLVYIVLLKSHNNFQEKRWYQRFKIFHRLAGMTLGSVILFSRQLWSEHEKIRCYSWHRGARQEEKKIKIISYKRSFNS